MLVPTHQPPPDAVAELAELREQVMAALRALPPGYRLPLTLRYIVGADYASIGEQLGMTNGALRGVLHRGMNLLRDLLPPDFAAGFLGRETN
jgi:RNA polymerase sigma-70 factor (ECF subfamily)